MEPYFIFPLISKRKCFVFGLVYCKKSRKLVSISCVNGFVCARACVHLSNKHSYYLFSSISTFAGQLVVHTDNRHSFQKWIFLFRFTYLTLSMPCSHNFCTKLSFPLLNTEKKIIVTVFCFWFFGKTPVYSLEEVGSE